MKICKQYVVIKISMPVKRKSKVPAAYSRRQNPEKIVTQNLLDGFVSKGSRGEALIEEILGSPLKKISLNGLIQVASLISDIANIQFPRNYKRKKDLIVKWFQDNEDIINTKKKYLQIKYEENNENPDIMK